MRNFVTSFAVGTSDGAANTGTGLETIKKGDILVVNYESGAVITGTSATVSNAPVIGIAYAIEDGKPIISGPIYGQNLVSGSNTAYAAPAVAKKAFGYSTVNTSAALPEVTEAEVFNVSILLKTDLRLHPNRQDRIDLSVKSKGGYDLARKIVNQLNAPVDVNPKLYADKYVVGTLTADGTSASIGTTATATVVGGSPKVTFSSDHSLAVGAVVSFPASGVFKVAKVVSDTVIELDGAYAGPSATLGATVAKELADSDNFGVQVDSKLIERSNPVDQYGQMDFEIGLSENFGLGVDVVQAYSPGSGTGWQVRDKEVACMGWMGYSDRRDTMRAEYPFQTEIGGKYRTVELASLAPVRGDLQQTFEGPQAVFIAFNGTTATQSTAVLAILRPWAASGGVTLA